MKTTNKIPVNGVLLLNKPLTISSNVALQRAKRIFNAKKAGHTGSLDPLATGMLPICFGEATKFSQFLLGADKYYTATAKLGEKTETGDVEGAVIETRAVPSMTEQELEVILDDFRGKSQQVPSMYSALKHQGRPLYTLARQGITVDREARDIEVHKLELVDFKAETFTINVHCSKGTYIRNLVEDIGEMIGCGAHVTALHRTGVATFSQDMYSLEQLAEYQEQASEQLLACLLPIDVLVQKLDKTAVKNAEAVLLLQGQVIDFKAENSEKRMTALYDEQQRFIGVGEILPEGRVKARRMLSLGACS